MDKLEPRDAQDLCDIVANASQTGRKLEIQGGGSKAAMGAPRDATVVSLAALTGVVDYDPAELVLTVRPGTPLCEVEALVAAQDQMLAFEPFDHGPLFANELGATTIGGVVAAGVAGSRRVTAGGARDHLLGFTSVSGRGEIFVGGAKVVKNVTGYDLPKLFAGSWGRLGAMTELTLKVLPRPRMTVTMAAYGLDPRAAHAAMACALGSNADVSAAAHLARGITLLRVAGFAPSVEARCEGLPGLVREHCALHRLDGAEATDLWREAATGAGLRGEVLWRVHLQPARAPDLIARLEPLQPQWSLDWGGGLVWLALDSHGTQVRDAAIALGGEATLVRSPEAMRRTVSIFQPRAGGVAALEERVRRAFDPAGVFETGRFLGEAHADQLRA